MHEYALFAVALLLGLTALTVRQRYVDRRAWGVAAGVGAVVLGLSAVWKPSVDDLARAVPAPLRGQGFATSDTCRSCHPSQYASWHASYHRTMTQVASPHSVLAPFILIRSPRVVNQAEISRLLKQRDGTPMRIVE